MELWLPQALVLGMTEEEFWHSNPRKLKAYVEAEKIKMKNEYRKENLISYINGIYTRDALLCTVCNMFKDKNTKAIEYPAEPYDFFKKTEEPKEFTEEQKIAQTKALFMKLQLMQTNDELAKN